MKFQLDDSHKAVLLKCFNAIGMTVHNIEILMQDDTQMEIQVDQWGLILVEETSVPDIAGGFTGKRIIAEYNTGEVVSTPGSYWEPPFDEPNYDKVFSTWAGACANLALRFAEAKIDMALEWDENI
jgi:hypothetical protein